MNCPLPLEHLISATKEVLLIQEAVLSLHALTAPPPDAEEGIILLRVFQFLGNLMGPVLIQNLFMIFVSSKILS